MTTKGKLTLWAALTCSLLSVDSVAHLRPGEQTSQGQPVVVVRNDTQASVTVESFVFGGWASVRIEKTKDVALAGTRVRVATSRRADNATITVDLPVKAGAKYSVIVNGQTGLLDFRLAGPE